jgi:3-oxoacyl-[acyl-carrier-protein] synthase-1
MTVTDQSALRANLKRLIVESLNLEGLTADRIADDAPLFGKGLGLDSVDALELVVALEKEYGMRIQSHEVDKAVFDSVASLADFVASVLSRPESGRSADER